MIEENYKIYCNFLERKTEDGFFDKLANIKADFLIYNYTQLENYLRTKSNPARKKADDLNEIKLKYRQLIKNNNLLIYKYELLFATFPELEDYFDSIEDILNSTKSTIDDVKIKYDYSKNYLSNEEYTMLSESDRNQLALDRYVKKNKNGWQIGRDFELFCGQKYSNAGWEVEYYGIEKRLKDLGRDLIIKKNNTIGIIQCKYWAEKKCIREKHIAQLYGTSKVYEKLLLKDGITDKIVVPLIISQSKLSEEAINFAKILGIQIIITKMKDFPRIKCNISSSGERIYHLPFDEQYDRTKIDKKGEFFAFTIKEAEEKGFRRAFKYFNK